MLGFMRFSRIAPVEFEIVLITITAASNGK
jgi:hypothetical protein